MKEQFTPYNMALELKELGFNKSCLAVYNKPNDEWIPTLVYSGILHEGYTNDLESFKVVCPLYQQAFQFFREKYNLYGQISIGEYSNRNEGFEYEIKSFDKTIDIWRGGYTTYEEARKACLEKLIKIAQKTVKQVHG